MQNEVVFYRRHLQALDLPSNLPSLGLLQAVEGLTCTCFSKSLSYNFLHPSVQELLAAYHISQLDPGQQLEVFKNLFGSARFQPVLHSFCGFIKLENPAIQTIFPPTCKKTLVLTICCHFCTASLKHKSVLICQLVDHKFRKLTLNSESC